jgi:hypothetical protein
MACSTRSVALSIPSTFLLASRVGRPEGKFRLRGQVHLSDLVNDPDPFTRGAAHGLDDLRKEVGTRWARQRRSKTAEAVPV